MEDNNMSNQIKIIDYLDGVEVARQRVTAAVNRKGGAIPSNASLNMLADAVDQLPAKDIRADIRYGEIPINENGQFLVRWIDVDGTVLKREYVSKGGTATPPPTPTFAPDLLEFTTWSSTSDYTNVQYPVDNGANYDTKPDAEGNHWTIVKIDIPYDNFEFTFPHRLISPSTNKYNHTFYIDWGDSPNIEIVEQADPKGATHMTHTHLYAKGNYTLRVYCAHSYHILDPYSTTSTLSRWDVSSGRCIKEFYIGNNFKFDSTATSFPSCQLKVLSFGSYFTGNSSYFYFTPCWKDFCLIIPAHLNYRPFTISLGQSTTNADYLGNYTFIIPRAYANSTFKPDSLWSYGFGLIPYFVLPENIKSITTLQYCTAGILVCPPGITAPEPLPNTFASNCFTQHIVNCPTITITDTSQALFASCNAFLNIPFKIADTVTDLGRNVMFLPPSCTSLIIPDTVTNVQTSSSTTYGVFYKYPLLNYVKLPTNWAKSITLGFLKFLSAESLAGIARDLADRTEQGALTLTISYMSYSVLLNTYVNANYEIVDKAVPESKLLYLCFTDKNWTVSVSNIQHTSVPGGTWTPILRGFNI